MKTICEVISGSLPLDKRSTFQSMLSGTKFKIDKIFVESARAVSRDADVAEQIYKAAKAANVEIIPQDWTESHPSRPRWPRASAPSRNAWPPRSASACLSVGQDLPGLFAHDPSPVETFMRRVVLAMTELEKNLIVSRLADIARLSQALGKLVFSSFPAAPSNPPPGIKSSVGLCTVGLLLPGPPLAHLWGSRTDGSARRRNSKP